MPLSLTTNPINYSTERRFLAEQSRTLVDQKAENLKTLQNSKDRIICKALSDEQFREHLFSSDILKRLKLPNTDESKLIIKGIQTDIDHHLALKLAAEELGVESTQSHYGDIIKAQQSKLEIFNAKKTMKQIEQDRSLAQTLQHESDALFETQIASTSYSENPLEDLSPTWKLKVTNPRVQRLNISGSGLYCGYYSLAMNIAQFSQSQREAIYDKLSVSQHEMNALEANRLDSIASDSFDSFYQQKLGQKLIDRYSDFYGNNISYDDLSSMAQDLGIIPVIVRGNDQFFSNLSLRGDQPVDTVTFSDEEIDSLRRVGILAYNNGQHYLTLTDSVQNLRDALITDFRNRQELDEQRVDGIFEQLFPASRLHNQQPIAVIYNKYGGAHGGHYEAPKNLAQLLF